MTIKRKSAPAREHSLAELRQINIRTMENHQKLNQIIDVRQQELGKMRDSLYVEVQNFREAHQAELRRSVEVAMDLATRSLPWWKRTLMAIKGRTEELIPVITELVKKEAERVKAEVEEINAKEQAEQLAAKKQLEKDQAELVAKMAAEADVNKDASIGKDDDGYGGALKEIEQKAKQKMAAAEMKTRLEIKEIEKGTRDQQAAIDNAADDYEVDEDLAGTSEHTPIVDALTPVDLNA